MREYAKLIKALRHCVENTDCPNCPYYTFCDNDVMIIAADAIEELLAESADLVEQVKRSQEEIRKLDKKIAKLKSSVPKWISVKDRLPEIGERVLIMFMPFEDDENISIGWLTKYGFDCYDDSVYFYRSVTHWMPLPKLPEERSANDGTF